MPMSTKWRRHMKGLREHKPPHMRNKKKAPPKYVQEQDQRNLMTGVG